jgi:hypothetical protein
MKLSDIVWVPREPARHFDKGDRLYQKADGTILYVERVFGTNRYYTVEVTPTPGHNKFDPDPLEEVTAPIDDFELAMILADATPTDIPSVLGKIAHPVTE